MAKDYTEWGILGFWATLLAAPILKFISQAVSAIPGVNLELQSVTVATTDVAGVIGTGFGEYAKKLFGMVPFLSLPEWIIAGIGGALFVMLGAWAYDNTKFLQQFGKTKQAKLTTILVSAGIVSGWILSMSIGLPPLSGIIVMVVDAALVSWVLLAIDKNTKMKIVP